MQDKVLATNTPEIKPCTVRLLPETEWIKAAATAIDINPVNAPALHQLRMAQPNAVPSPLHLALLTQKYWGIEGVNLTVGFMDNPSAELRRTILSHMNAWGKFGNVKFRESGVNPQVRIARERDGGYWSYLGTDILHIDSDKPTMNLDSFTMYTPVSEFYRVVRHETGHTLGFPHEHTRAQIVDQIDREKAIEYFMRTQGWTRQDVIDQVLTPLDPDAAPGTPEADHQSIMCYWLPAEIMKDNIAIPGGTDIDDTDADFAAIVYPKPKNATPAANRMHMAGAMMMAKAMGMPAMEMDRNEDKETEIGQAVKNVLSGLTEKPVSHINDEHTLTGDLHLTDTEIRSMATPLKSIARRYKSGIMITPDECADPDTVQGCIDLILDKIK